MNKSIIHFEKYDGLPICRLSRKHLMQHQEVYRAGAIAEVFQIEHLTKLLDGRNRGTVVDFVAARTSQFHRFPLEKYWSRCESNRLLRL